MKYGFDISEKTINQIVNGIVDDIRNHRPNELYDEEVDPYEGRDNFLADFLADIVYLTNEKMKEKYIDENHDIIG